jgi:hypothetical protein
MIKRTVFVFFLFIVLSFATSLAQEDDRSLPDQLIELEGSNGRILVFPKFFPGPKGPVVKFVMFGIYKFPEVFVRTIDETFTPDVTTVHFSKGDRFSGWFDIPEEEIVSIWIDGWFIPWEDTRIQ